MQPVQLGFDIPASLNLSISNLRCTEHPVLLIQQQLHLFVQLGFDIPPLTHPAVIEPALYAHHYFADSTIFVSPLTTEVRYPSALIFRQVEPLLYDTRYLSHSTHITPPNTSFHTAFLATPYFTGNNVSIQLILRALYGHLHRPRDEPALMLQPANTANIPDEDVPFHASRVLALCGSDLHNICSTPIFTPSAPIRPFSPLDGRRPGGR